MTSKNTPSAQVRTIESFEAECEACDWHSATVEDDLAAQAAADKHNREVHA
ncbi:hypothetical protein TSOC111612_01485 [Tsukamurella ocularis]|uniref:hypothetical protein n=1 Tax=Tsukamurella ocularis TaxID=1970234 RepID=UPI0039EF2CBC